MSAKAKFYQNPKYLCEEDESATSEDRNGLWKFLKITMLRRNEQFMISSRMLLKQNP